MLERIAILGAGGLGRELVMLIEQINRVAPRWGIAGFYDSTMQPGKVVDGLPVLGPIEEAPSGACRNLVIGIAEPAFKRRLFAQCTGSGVVFPTLVHPSVVLPHPDRWETGEGVVVCANSVISVDVRLGRFVLVNVGCQIGHDAKVGDFSSIMPHCNVSGCSELGEASFMGVKSVIIDKVRVGSEVTVGAGAVVFSHVDDGVTVMGSPARVMFRKSQARAAE